MSPWWDIRETLSIHYKQPNSSQSKVSAAKSSISEPSSHLTEKRLSRASKKQID